MRKSFIERVVREGIVDTRKYRYIMRGAKIFRLPISCLGTTQAIDGWELVFEFGKY